jgi:hypothetical protein
MEQSMNNDRGKKSCIIILVILLMSYSSCAFGQAVSDEAKRHFDRGTTAVEMAKSPQDYAPAIREFEQAVSLAPNWPNAYYSLGKAQEKAEKYSNAITSLKQYLRLAPNASDAETVKTLVNKLEYRMEREEGVNKVYNMMASDLYSRKQISRNVVSGANSGHSSGPLQSFRMESGKLQAENGWYASDREHGGGYHPRQHPPIARQWEPVKVDGKFYEYTYSHYMDTSISYVVRVDYAVKGEVISVDPPRVTETVKCSITWGAPIEGNKRSWNRKYNSEEVMEYTNEYVPK